MTDDTQDKHSIQNNGDAQAVDRTGQDKRDKSPSRRSLLGWGGAGLALGAVAAGGAVAAVRDGDSATPAADTGAAVPFHGPHQSGIATAVQDRLHFAAFDVTTKDRAELAQLLKDWTRADWWLSGMMARAPTMT
ncbi:Dyp-type peroxidase domain-containing protein, partial [Streptomyces sp. NPDC001840]